MEDGKTMLQVLIFIIELLIFLFVGLHIIFTVFYSLDKWPSLSAVLIFAGFIYLTSYKSCLCYKYTSKLFITNL